MSKVKPNLMSAQELFRALAEAIDESSTIIQDPEDGKTFSFVSSAKLKANLIGMAQRIEREWLEN